MRASCWTIDPDAVRSSCVIATTMPPPFCRSTGLWTLDLGLDFGLEIHDRITIATSQSSARASCQPPGIRRLALRPPAPGSTPERAQSPGGRLFRRWTQGHFRGTRENCFEERRLPYPSATFAGIDLLARRNCEARSNFS